MLVVSLFCLLSLRFYVFYMMVVAVGGAFPYRHASRYGAELLAPVYHHHRSGAVADIYGCHALRERATRHLCKLDMVQRSRLDAAKVSPIRFRQRCGRLDYLRSPDGHSDGPALSSFRAFPLAIGFVASEHHASGNDHLVGVVSDAGFGALVLHQISPATDLTYPRVFGDALAGLLSLSGQRGHGVPAARATPGLLFHLCRGGLCADAGEKRGSQAAGRSRAKRKPPPPPV